MLIMFDRCQNHCSNLRSLTTGGESLVNSYFLRPHVRYSTYDVHFFTTTVHQGHYGLSMDICAVQRFVPTWTVCNPSAPTCARKVNQLLILFIKGIICFNGLDIILVKQWQMLSFFHFFTLSSVSDAR